MPTDYPRRKSFLTLTPIDFSDFSLTEDTNNPAPPDTPPRSPSPIPLARPPTQGGGPLSSHPTSAEDIRSATLPPTPDPEHEVLAKMSTSTSSNHDSLRNDSFRTPDSPASAQNKKASKAEQQKAGQSVRKLFSLNNLRNSFSSSRTSLQSQNPSAETSLQPPPQADSFRQRPASGHNITPQMRPRGKSGSWFKRKSSMFMFNGNEDLDVVTEDRPATESTQKAKEEYNPAPVRAVHSAVLSRETHSSASSEEDYIGAPVVRSQKPLLPEIGGLGNGDKMSGGDLGWDEGMFKR